MKKIISMILALVMVFAIGATAFAATDNTVTGSVPSHNHEWSDWTNYEDRQERHCEECGITEIIYKDGVDESNPNTGASAAIGMAVLVAAAAATSFKRG